MDDLEFLQSCLRGEKQAWSDFILRYSRLIYNYIYSVLAIQGCRLSRCEVEDIFQEIFHSLIKDNYKKLSTYRGRNGCSLGSWLRQVTINFTIDYLRSLKPVVSIYGQEEGGGLQDILSDSSPGAAQFLSNKEKRRTLERCIGSLNLEDQYFLELFLNQELGLDQIKDHLRLNRGAIDMRRSRILRKLRDCFREKGFLW
jgi:RNA polymerase sigma factor (sigma-70 family)